jgi:hypothetical protein
MAIGVIGPLPSQRCTRTPATPTNPAGKAALPTPPRRVPRPLKLVAKAYPRRQLPVVLDNHGTHTQSTAKAWLAKPPRVHRHFTPTSAVG